MRDSSDGCYLRALQVQGNRTWRRGRGAFLLLRTLRPAHHVGRRERSGRLAISIVVALSHRLKMMFRLMQLPSFVLAGDRTRASTRSSLPLLLTKRRIKSRNPGSGFWEMEVRLA